MDHWTVDRKKARTNNGLAWSIETVDHLLDRPVDHWTVDRSGVLEQSGHIMPRISNVIPRGPRAISPTTAWYVQHRRRARDLARQGAAALLSDEHRGLAIDFTYHDTVWSDGFTGSAVVKD